MKTVSNDATDAADDGALLGGWHTTVQPPALARLEDVLDAVAAELEASGVAGESGLIRILYLAATSRLLPRPCSVVVKGPSAGGKSFLVGRVLDLFPPDAYYALTAMSERAMAYDKEPLVHRMLVIYEAAGMHGETATYLIRSLLSEGRIDYVTVVSTKGGPEPRRVTRPGPTGLITTTTAVSLHPENETRMLSLTVSDSPEQTRAVMVARATGSSPVRDREPWHDFQTWLAAQPRAVVVPYALTLAEAIPTVSIRLRRDFGMLVTLIQANALLHQLYRQRDGDGAILADFDDYATVRELASHAFAEAVERSVAVTVRETVEALARLEPEDLLNEGLPVTRLATALGLDKSSASRRVRVAVARGFIRNLEERRGRPHRLVLGDALPDDGLFLPTAVELERLHGCVLDEAGEEQIRSDYPRSAWDTDADSDEAQRAAAPALAERPGGQL